MNALEEHSVEEVMLTQVVKSLSDYKETLQKGNEVNVGCWTDIKSILYSLEQLGVFKTFNPKC